MGKGCPSHQRIMYAPKKDRATRRAWTFLNMVSLTLPGDQANVPPPKYPGASRVLKGLVLVRRGSRAPLDRSGWRD
eukprot:8096721-Pyramimonas_sp.AAC.1